MKIHAQKRTAAAPAVLLAVLTVLALSACETVNRLGEFDIQGHTMAAQMRLPPEPTMDVHYHVTVDFSDPIGTALNVGSNIAKAANADRVERLMRQALTVVDVPGMVRDESYATSLSVLGAEGRDNPDEAEYLLDFDIAKWGIHASSWVSAVSLRMHLTAALYSNAEKAIVWRREIRVERAATPVMFGLDRTLGNFVTSATLAGLSEEDLMNGFDQLARDTALEVSRTLQNDLYDARYVN
jgi:predicted small secreted protein